MVRDSVPSPPTVTPAPRKLVERDGPGEEDSSLVARFALLLGGVSKGLVCVMCDILYARLRLCKNVLDYVLRIGGVAGWILDSQAGLLAASKEVSRPPAIIQVVFLFVIVIIVVVVVVVMASTTDRAQCSQALLLSRLLGGGTGGRESGLGGGSTVESSWARVLWLWDSLGGRTSSTCGRLLVIGEVGSNGARQVPVAGFEVLGGLRNCVSVKI